VSSFLEFIVSRPLFGPSTRRYAAAQGPSTRAFGTAQDEEEGFNLILRWPEGPSKDGCRGQKCELEKR